MKNRILPNGLTKNGFDYSTKEEDQINILSLNYIIKFINTNFDKTESINFNHSSYGLSLIIITCIGKHVSIGGLIAAMILCGYNYHIYGKYGAKCSFNIKTISENKLIAIFSNHSIYIERN